MDCVCTVLGINIVADGVNLVNVDWSQDGRSGGLRRRAPCCTENGIKWMAELYYSLTTR